MDKRNSRNAYYAFIILLYFFLLRDWLERKISVFGYVDEILAVLAVPIIIFIIQKNCFRIKKGAIESPTLFIHGFALMGLCGSIIYRYQPVISVALPDLLLCLKFWLTIITGRFLFSKLDLRYYSRRLFRHIKLITWIFVVLVVFDNIFKVFPADVRHGIRSTQLFYYHTTVFGSCIILLMCVLMCIKERIGKQATIYFLVLSLLVVSTMRTRLIGTVAVFWLIWYFIYIRKKPFRIRTLLIIVPIILLIGWDKIQFYFNGASRDQSARYMLLLKSASVASDHFPIGSGFGTYGSFYSSVVYSPLYYKYGLNIVFGLTPETGGYISDSFWPMILAQTGWIGLALYILAIIMLFRRIRKLRRIDIQKYFVGIFILLYILIESTAGSAFVHPLVMPLALLLGYVFNSEERVIPIKKICRREQYYAWK